MYNLHILSCMLGWLVLLLFPDRCIPIAKEKLSVLCLVLTIWMCLDLRNKYPSWLCEQNNTLLHDIFGIEVEDAPVLLSSKEKVLVVIVSRNYIVLIRGKTWEHLIATIVFLINCWYKIESGHFHFAPIFVFRAYMKITCI